MDSRYREELINQIKQELAEENFNFSRIGKLINREALLSFATWTEKPFTRICLFENTAFELILICWNPLAQTTVHDHNEQSCSVFFFDGPFQETIYCHQGEEVLHTKNIKQGSSSTMKEGKQCHSLKNMSDEKVMTLHLYNEPIKECRVRKNKAGFPMEMKTMEYDFLVHDTVKI